MHLSNTANEKNGLRRDMIFRHNTLFCANLSKEYYGKFSNQTNYGTNHAKRSNHDVLPIWNQMVSQAFFFFKCMRIPTTEDIHEVDHRMIRVRKRPKSFLSNEPEMFLPKNIRDSNFISAKGQITVLWKKKSLRDLSDTWKSLKADDKILLNTESWQWCISRNKNAAK